MELFVLFSIIITIIAIATIAMYRPSKNNEEGKTDEKVEEKQPTANVMAESTEEGLPESDNTKPIDNQRIEIEEKEAKKQNPASKNQKAN